MIFKCLIFLLCVSMTLANAVCVCAAEPSTAKGVQEKCCIIAHDHDACAASVTMKLPVPQKSHHCSHCTGAILATRNARSNIAISSPLQTLAAPFHSTHLTLHNFNIANPMQVGEPSPNPSDTLLRLACALQI